MLGGCETTIQEHGELIRPSDRLDGRHCVRYVPRTTKRSIHKDISSSLPGKSTVSRLLTENHNLPLIDADLLAREVIDPGTSGYKLVVNHFGPDRVLQQDGVTLNRAAIGDIVFNDPDERKWLNGVIHPRVRKEIVRRVVKYWLTGEWAVIVDVPLLIEAGLWKWVGEIVVVYVYVASPSRGYGCGH